MLHGLPPNALPAEANEISSFIISDVKDGNQHFLPNVDPFN
jgi:hypothetical protein